MDIIIQVKTFIKPISLTVFYPIWQIKVFNPSSNAAPSTILELKIASTEQK